jgi:hypothetical protein
MKRFSGIDYDDRPESYWQEGADPIDHALRTLGDAQRRKVIADLWREGKLGEVLAEILAANLSPEEELGPHNLGPPDGSAGAKDDPRRFLSGEVELLRVTIGVPALNRISLRARPAASGRIAYRIVDDEERFYAPEPAFSDAPLTLGELIELLESVRPAGTVRRFLQFQVRQGMDPALAAATARVESALYPDVTRHFALLAGALAEEARVPELRYGPDVEDEE